MRTSILYSPVTSIQVTRFSVSCNGTNNLQSWMKGLGFQRQMEKIFEGVQSLAVSNALPLIIQDL